MVNHQDIAWPYRWGILGLFTFGFATIIVSINSLGLLLPDIADDLALSPSEQGWLGSSVLFANVIFSIPVNLWVSRYTSWRIASVAAIP